MPPTAFLHPTIGEIKGISKTSGVAQFLGLQYATAQDRFAPAIIRDYGDGESVDATTIGPQVLCHAPGPDLEFVLLQHGLDYDRDSWRVSDTEGLILNIAVPTDSNGQVLTDRKLPVFAFIHGGGFNVGSASFPQYDMSRLVQTSVEQGMPIIAVSISYRLSVPGFMASKDLRSAGYKPNNGLRDQRTALQWIQSYISGFGGDPSNVTLMGESAGAISVNYHLHSQNPLFKRCMLMSGSSLLMPPASLEAAETSYNTAIKALGLDSLTSQERIQSLLTMPGQELCTKCLKAGLPIVPILDNDLISSTPTFSNITSNTLDLPGLNSVNWCTSLLLGDCQFDGNIQSLRLMNRQSNIASAFCSSMTASLPNNIAQKLFSAYDLHPMTPDLPALNSILQILNDVNFYAPTLTLASSFSKRMKTYMYRFNEPNPWEGTWKGQAIHIQDLTWLLQNFREFLGEKQQEQGRAFAEGVVSFVNGVECWEAWREDRRMAMVIGPEGKMQVVKDEEPGNGRRRTVFELAKEVEGGLDVLSKALEWFMKG